MADLTGTSIKDNYKRIIQLTGSGQVELSASAGTGKYLTDGAGNASPFALSQSRAGLGTDSPEDLLHLYSGSGSAGIRIDSQLPSVLLIDNNSPTGGAGTFKLQTDGTDDSNVGAFIIEDLNASLVSQGKPFIIQTGADTNSLYIQADNKVGIGTSTPAKALDVAGDIGLTGDIYVAQAKNIYFDSTDTKIYADATGDEKLYIEADSDIVLAPDVNLVINATALDVNSATIDTSTQTVTVELNQAADSFTFDGAADNILSIDGANNRVGIGTAAPASTLEISATVPEIRLTDSDASGTPYALIQASQGNLTISADDSAAIGSSNIAFEVDNSEAMRIIAGGDIGIGTTSPAADLDVNSADDEVALFRATTTYSSGSSGPYIGLEGKDSDGTNRELARIKATSTGADIGDLQFQTRSSTTPSTKMTILNSGDVGIGTASPSCEATGNSLLHIADTGGSNPAILNLSGGTGGNASASGVIAFTDPGVLTQRIAQIVGEVDGTDASDVGGKLDFYTQLDNGALTHRMVIKNDGNVGIGTTSPDGTLHIADNSAADDKPQFIIENTNAGQYSPSILFKSYSDRSTAHIRSGFETGSNWTDTKTIFAVSNSAGVMTDLLTLHNSNVGIGTTSPLALLSTFGGVNGGPPTSSTTSNAIVRLGGVTGDTSAFALDIGQTNSGTNRYWMQTRNNVADLSDTSYPALTLNELGGNGGIGTAAPSALLEIEGVGAPLVKVHATNISGVAGFSAVGTTSAQTRTCTAGVYKHGGITRGCAYIGFQAVDGAQGFLWLDDDDDLRASEDAAHIGTGTGQTVHDDITASDERLKDISSDAFPYGLSDINKLTPIRFKYKNKSKKDWKLGLGAQTTQPIVPETVLDTGICIDGYDYDPDDTMKATAKSDDTKLTMSYNQFIPILIKAVQELSAEVDKLKQQ